MQSPLALVLRAVLSGDGTNGGVHRLKAENSALRQQQGQLPDLDAVRERSLKGCG